MSGAHFTMNFLLLCIQSMVCVACVTTVKRLGIISFRALDWQDAKTWFPVSFMLVSVIYTGSKSLVCVCYTWLVIWLTNICPAISEYPRVHHLQKLDYYSHRKCQPLLLYKVLTSLRHMAKSFGLGEESPD